MEELPRPHGPDGLRSCLFLQDWEPARVLVHDARRQRAEGALADLQLRVQNSGAAVTSWLAVLRGRAQADEAAAAAVARAAEELEGRWRPVRHDRLDGEAAAWLLEAERARAAALRASAARWASAVPEDAEPLLRRCTELSARISGALVEAARAWDEAHRAAQQTWDCHNERLEAAAKVVAEAQPDTWITEVRYRERAGAYLARAAGAERLLAEGAADLAALEEDRARLWGALSAAYAGAAVAGGAGAAQPPAPPALALAEAGAAPPAAPPVLALPAMPSSCAGVLQQLQVATLAPAGMFGIGGGWREGGTLVLTIQGYIHLFAPDGAQAAGGDAPGAGDGSPAARAPAEDSLVESAIVASVYVPMASRCVFLRKGKELTVDLQELEVAAEASAAHDGGPEPGRAAGLRRWLSRSSAGPQQPAVPRRVQARASDSAAFSALEGRCHEFVRKGKGLRDAAAAAAAARAEAREASAPPQGR